MNTQKTGTSADLFVGSRARERREAMGISTQDLSAAVGLSPALIEQFETGKSRIEAIELRALAKALGVKIHYFFRS